jgi:hypothetical protein
LGFDCLHILPVTAGSRARKEPTEEGRYLKASSTVLIASEVSPGGRPGGSGGGRSAEGGGGGRICCIDRPGIPAVASMGTAPVML